MCGTTPTHTFTVPFSVDVIKSVRVIYSQNDKPVVVKETADCVLANNTVVTKLTQKETMSFDPKVRVEIQLHVLTTTDESIVSSIKCVSVGRCLDKDVIV